MRSELAEELLTTLMGWDRAAFVDRVRELEALATYKYDEYGNFRPGIKFFESLAAWLNQFTPDERAVALDFVLEHLVFVSDAEMTHLIELVYTEHIDVVLRRRVSHETGVDQYRVAATVMRSEFTEIRRRSLILGASDGSRLDRLRRSSPVLSHEQFLQSSEPPPDLVSPMRTKLAEALGVGIEEASFRHVFLVDDFSGSGETMLRAEGHGYKGKLVKLKNSLEALVEVGLLEPEHGVTVILYLASEQAELHIRGLLAEAGMAPWELRVVQSLPLALRVSTTAPAFAQLAEVYYDDEAMTDEHKGRAPVGYAGCELPLVLAHNTPNNSVSLLWADSSGDADGSGQRALFPRYERHHKDRP
jgi:hypothetical protein